MTVGPDVPDYSRPCVDVDRETHADWQWGVTHTVQPEKLAPMLPGVEYSVTVKVQRMVTDVDLENDVFRLVHPSHRNRWRQMP